MKKKAVLWIFFALKRYRDHLANIKTDIFQNAILIVLKIQVVYQPTSLFQRYLAFFKGKLLFYMLNQLNHSLASSVNLELIVVCVARSAFRVRQC
jgi:hypothetical protein